MNVKDDISLPVDWRDGAGLGVGLVCRGFTTIPPEHLVSYMCTSTYFFI